MTRYVFSILRYAATAVIGASTFMSQLPPARAADFQTSRMAFLSLPSSDRFAIPLLLIATDHYSGIASGDYNHRIDRGIRDFQIEVGDAPTGILSPAERTFLNQRGYGFIARIGLREVELPNAQAKLFVPLNLLEPRTFTSRGYAYEALDSSVSVDLAYYPAGDIPFHVLYGRFSADRAARKVKYKVLRDDFFVTSGSYEGRDYYTRFQLRAGSATGFTVSWNTDLVPEGGRIAVLMSNLFSVGEGLPAMPSQDVAIQTPTPAVPSPPTQQQAIAPPAPPPTLPPASHSGGTFSGSGFFIGSVKLVTNAHVVEGCDDVTLSLEGKTGTGRVVARDVTNDLAIIESSFAPPQTALLRASPRLGENVSVFGFPFAGVLATGGNFTRGNITAIAGLGDDSRFLQVSAPVQPGNSGGPLLDESGNVIGVVSSKLDAIKVAVAMNDVPQNVNFAIKASTLQSFLESQRATYATGSLGVAMSPADIAAKAQQMTAKIICHQTP